MRAPTTPPARSPRDPGGGRRVLGFVGEPPNGVSYVRFHQPFRYLRESGFELATLGRDLTLVRTPRGPVLGETYFESIEAVLFPQMVASPRLADGSRLDLVTPACELAARRGLKVVYSLDDCPWAIDSRNPGFERVRDSIDNARTILEHADALFVTTPALRDTLAKQGKPIHVLPNAIEPALWQPRPRTSDEPRLGWAGSGSHVEDLLMVLPAVAKLQRRLPCRFILLGLTPTPIAEEAAVVRRGLRSFGDSQRERAEAFLELAGMLDGIRHEHVPFTDLASYIERLPRADLDVGLCPLVDTEFNRHKSALKFYEYAACGTLTVASDLPPYRDEVSLLASADCDAWCDTLETYLRDSARRDAELERQRAFVLAERDIEHLSKLWARALRQTLDGHAAPRHAASSLTTTG